jgi:hypothetical protein
VLTEANQRWRAGRVSYRPVGEVINPLDYDIWRVWSDEEVKAFVIDNHYAGSYPAARQRFALWRKGRLVGVAIFSHPMSNGVLTSVLPGDPEESLELGRLILLDDVPANAESYFIGECLRQLRRAGFVGVVSFSDPVPRWSGDRLVLRGHVGVVYCACNALYVGRATPRTLYMFEDGSVLSARTQQKILGDERGDRHAIKQLVDRGAHAPTKSDRVGEWLALWRARLTKRVRHPGNLKYVFPLGTGVDKHVRKVAQVKRYPKAERDDRGAIVRVIE